MKSADNQTELVIISYRVDLDQCVQLIKSIREHGFINRDIVINVVVNDSPDVLLQHKEALGHIHNVKVLHGADFNISYTRGWLSQQWLKLAVAKHISTPWYIIIDSDQCLWSQCTTIEHDHWFVDNKAYYKETRIDSFLQQFQQYWHNAAKHWGIKLDSVSQTLLSETPPVAMHTQTVCNMLDHCDKNLFVKHNLVHEFGLYWTYLIKENLIDQLYVPFESLDRTNVLRHGRPCPEII